MRVSIVRDKERTAGAAETKPVNSAAGRQALLLLRLHETIQLLGEDTDNRRCYAEAVELLRALSGGRSISWAEIEEVREKLRHDLGTFRRGLVEVIE